ncbi:sulfotransferase [Pelagibius sp. Alg239-R121]|uniref:sulfotransferase n=1 Tax=Pelagibius sp. Alg239-R121 TaxID=2993448 RepID=UPI0024A707A1|nr:sulfotransferase [Pelagibius sp. Alg239-R121]
MSDSAYGTTSKVLHRLALASPMVVQVSHDIESMMNRGAVAPRSERHVFVAGLARAGTTIVMRSLYQSGLFRSLTYRDMPFVLMPRTWSGISSLFRRHKEQEERAHGDRVMVNFDSPEAFEEVFWRSFCGADYIFEDALRPHRPDEEIVSQFRRFVENILASGESDCQLRYLSKNNNNLLRLPAIAEAFPEAAIFVPYRDPIQHALSLSRQHELFRQTHAQDAFALDYMNWLGHHEFGGNHRPFRFGESGLELATFSPDGLDYWLCCWADAYAYTLKNLPETARLISYEGLCAQDGIERARLHDHAGLSAERGAKKFEFTKARPHAAPDVTAKVKARVYELYAALQDVH